MKKNSDNLNGAEINTKGGDVNVNIGDQMTFILPNPQMAFSHNKFVEVLGEIDNALEESLLHNQIDLTRIDMERKNQLNNIDIVYYEQVILENLKDNFDEIDKLLESPRFKKEKRTYDRVAKELNQSYLANRKKFKSIPCHIDYIKEMMYNVHNEKLEEFNKDMVSLIMQHMYFECLYGERPSKE